VCTCSYKFIFPCNSVSARVFVLGHILRDVLKVYMLLVALYRFLLGFGRYITCYYYFVTGVEAFY
jgi:hypothetical protein